MKSHEVALELLNLAKILISAPDVDLGQEAATELDILIEHIKARQMAELCQFVQVDERREFARLWDRLRHLS